MSEGDVAHGRDAAPTSGPTTPARCCAPGSTRWTSTSTSDELLDAAAGRRASATPTSTAAPGASTSASSRARRRRDGRRRPRARPAPASARRAAALFDACVPAIPYAPAAAFLGREKAKLTRQRGRPPAGRARRRRHRRDARRHAHARARSASAACPGFEVEVIGTDADVDRRLQRGRRGRHPLLRGPAGRRAEPPGDRRALAEGRYDLRPPLLARPGRASRLRCSRGCWSCRWSAATTPSSRAYAASAHRRRRGSRRSRDCALGAFYGACDVVLSPSPATDERLRAARHRRASGSAAGTAASTSSASSPRCAMPGLLARRGQRALRRAPHQGEGRRPARRRVPRGSRARDPRLHLVLAGGGPEEERPARRGSASTRDLPRLAGRRRPRARLRERRRVPVRQPDRHLRPGHARGAGQRPAGGRGRRGRPVLDRRDGVTGLLRPPEPVRWRTRSSSSPPARSARAPGRAALEAVSGRTWERALAQLAAGYARALATA